MQQKAYPKQKILQVFNSLLKKKREFWYLIFDIWW
jgi:hypothetical protein